MPMLLNLTNMIDQVGELVTRCTAELDQRAIIHDASKWEPEEYGPYQEAYPRLQAATYGSEEYKAALRSIKPAVQRHVEGNRHHPEYLGYNGAGIAGMNLLDVIEMCCDWIAASRRVDPNGTPNLPLNVERYHIDPQLAHILENTIAYLTNERNPHPCLTKP